MVTVRAQLSLGSGNELRPTATGKRPAHAPYSSAALAANAFGRWLGSERQLRLAGLGGFTEPLTIEEKLKIACGGGTANLDCVLQADGVIVGVESKLTETLEPHRPVAWRAPYLSPDMGAMLDGGWNAVFRASVEGSWQPAHLGVEQLLKHALALASQAADERHLVYVFWEPLNADEHPEVIAHRAEVAELTDRVADGWPRLHVLSYRELLDEWSALTEPDWTPEHVAQLRARYELPVPTA